MKRFISYLLILIIILLITSELIVRIFNLSNTPLNKVKKEDITLSTPYQSGTMVFGNFGDIRAKFKINPQGFNSVYDYDELFIGNKYAIIGDSFVEGYHEDVDSSIGRRIENVLPQTRINEYGRSGWNANNYLQMCNILANQYDQVFVICSVSDFTRESANHHTINNSVLKQIIFKSRLIRYLYYNRKFARLLKNKQPSTVDSFVINKSPHDKIALLQRKFPENIVWVWRDSEAAAFLKYDNNIAVQHDLKPYNFGLLDGHWNSNGRQNAANTIVAFIKHRTNDK